MFVYRIAKTERVRDLTGTGTRLYGSRWSHPGIPIIFTSESIALARLEYYVHVTKIPPNTSLATIEIPDRSTIQEIMMTGLPRGWDNYPGSNSLKDIGSKWAKSNISLILRVPSAQAPPECNILINPAHPEMKNVQIIKVENFKYDVRLKK
ncbi:MAG TPA: RES family NAD+ phosphorylase [Syntrophales bacterium]|nr:RES family NAD+ phosphorylase [Syntrophales bacterium]